MNKTYALVVSLTLLASATFTLTPNANEMISTFFLSIASFF